jgi:DNA-binding NtrC family response regulator
VLIVDDEVKLRRTLAEILSAQGYETAESGSVSDRLQAIADRQPDIVFCDWKMPGSDGDKLLDEPKRPDLLRAMPVVIITAQGTSQNAIKAMQLGAYDFVTKPFDLDEICPTTRRALEHARLHKEVGELREKLNKGVSPRPIK